MKEPIRETYISAFKKSDNINIDISGDAMTIGIMLAHIVSNLTQSQISIALIAFTTTFTHLNPLSNIKMCAGSKKDVLNLLQGDNHEQKLN